MVDHDRKLSFPLASFVMAIIGTPWFPNLIFGFGMSGCCCE